MEIKDRVLVVEDDKRISNFRQCWKRTITM